MKLKIFHFYIELKKVPKRGRKRILRKRGRKQRRISLNCDYCGKKIIRIPSRFAKSKRHFCSCSCYAKFDRKILVDCPFCERKGFKSHSGLVGHIQIQHPEQYRGFLGTVGPLPHPIGGGQLSRKNSVRRESIKQMRIENPSATLLEIGAKCGVTRERVRQILKGEGLPTKSYKEAKSPVQRYCAHCGAEIPLSGRLRKYCLKCSQESQRYSYHFLDDEAKRRQRLHQIAWMKRNPEKVKVVQERATKKYQNRVRPEHYRTTHYMYTRGNLLPLGIVFKAIGCDANHRLVLSDGRKIPVSNVRKVEN